YVELYYWTNHGLADARLNSRTMDDDSMVPTVGSEGTTAWTVASAARPAIGVIPDHLLAPLDFSRAIPHFINSLEQRGWNTSHVRILASFFGALMLHNYWTLDEPFELPALLTYQEEQH
ncbi:hypothetical protein BDR03DRAFT_869042, partial [Suillus americanus]